MARRRRKPLDDELASLSARLRALGYSKYADYLASEHWQDTRRRYRASPRPQRCICGARGTQLHHTTYVRLGREHLMDLVLLCEACHMREHGKGPPRKMSKREQKRAPGKAKARTERRRADRAQQMRDARKPKKPKPTADELNAFLAACAQHSFEVKRLR